MAAVLAVQVPVAGLPTCTGHVLALTDTTALDLRRYAQRLRPATGGVEQGQQGPGAASAPRAAPGR